MNLIQSLSIQAFALHLENRRKYLELRYGQCMAKLGDWQGVCEYFSDEFEAQGIDYQELWDESDSVCFSNSYIYFLQHYLCIIIIYTLFSLGIITILILFFFVLLLSYPDPFH